MLLGGQTYLAEVVESHLLEEVDRRAIADLISRQMCLDAVQIDRLIPAILAALVAGMRLDVLVRSHAIDIAVLYHVDCTEMSLVGSNQRLAYDGNLVRMCRLVVPNTNLRSYLKATDERNVVFFGRLEIKQIVIFAENTEKMNKPQFLRSSRHWN